MYVLAEAKEYIAGRIAFIRLPEVILPILPPLLVGEDGDCFAFQRSMERSET